jgi:hypothetical protein
MSKWERCAAALLLLNGALGLCATLGAATVDAMPSAMPWSLLGIFAGLLALRAPAIGLAAGMVYYLPQVASFHSQGFSFSVRSGISLGWVITTGAGVLVINLAALALAGLGAFLVARRVRVRWQASGRSDRAAAGHPGTPSRGA